MAETDPCGWCGAPSVTRVITVKGNKNRKTAPVCEQHAVRFENEGQMTLRLEFDLKHQSSERSRKWKEAHIRY